MAIKLERTVDGLQGYLAQTRKLFASRGIDGVDADLLFSHALDCSVTQLKLERGLTAKQKEKIDSCVARRLLNEPVSQIIGVVEFCGFKIKVNKNVLSPRRETEILVEAAARAVKNRIDRKKMAVKPICNNPTQSDAISVLDLCTGSGAVAIALSRMVNEEVLACDVDNKAILQAKENAKENFAKVRFLLSDMFKGLAGMKFDIIMCNPPYISLQEWESLDKSVKNYEPKTALTDFDDGLKFYRILAKTAPEHLNAGGQIFLETGYNQATEVAKLLEQNFTGIKIIKDYSGIERVIAADRK